MQIIAGKARNTELETLPGTGVRPTAGRSRKALFDALGDFSGKHVLDLCAGSGALGLEAASRGAEKAVLIELEKKHAGVIERNILRVQKCGVLTDIKLLNLNVLSVNSYRLHAPMDFIFSDPPYAQSAEIFAKLVNDPVFSKVFAGAFMVWEIPDTPGAAGPFLIAAAGHFSGGNLRNFGGTNFYTGVLHA